MDISIFIIEESVEVTYQDDNSDGFYNSLIVNFDIQSDVEGAYVDLTLVISLPYGFEPLFERFSRDETLSQGVNEFFIEMSSQRFYNSIYQGKLNLEIWGEAKTDSEYYYLENIQTTFDFEYSMFEKPPIRYTGIESVEYIDYDNSGKYDYIQFNLGFLTDQNIGIHMWANIFEPDTMHLQGGASNSTWFESGEYVIQLKVAGEIFSGISETSKFVMHVYLDIEYEGEDTLDSRFPPRHFEFSVKDQIFDEPALLLDTDNYSVEYLDLDGSGKADFLEVSIGIIQTEECDMDLWVEARDDWDHIVSNYSYFSINSSVDSLSIHLEHNSLYNTFIQGPLILRFIGYVHKYNPWISYGLPEEDVIINFDYEKMDPATITFEKGSMDTVFAKNDNQTQSKFDTIKTTVKLRTDRAVDISIFAEVRGDGDYYFARTDMMYPYSAGSHDIQLEFNKFDLANSYYEGQIEVILGGWAFPTDHDDYWEVRLPRFVKELSFIYRDFQDEPDEYDQNGDPQLNINLPVFPVAVALVLLAATYKNNNNRKAKYIS